MTRISDDPPKVFSLHDIIYSIWCLLTINATLNANEREKYKTEKSKQQVVNACYGIKSNLLLWKNFCFF